VSDVKMLAAAALAAAVSVLAFSARAEAAEDGSSSVRAPSGPSADRPSRERSDGDTDALRLGAVAGIGFPHPLAIEGLVKIDRVLALGVEYSFMPTTTFSGVESRAWALAADARVFPFRNGFFLGVRGGRQVLNANTTVAIGGLGSIAESARAEAWFINPRVGFLWTWRSGFTVGIDAGVQLPINATLTTTLPSGLAGGQIDQTIASVANAFGNGVTPTVDLLRLGFLF
jgi:hypothetical protein